MNPENPVAPTPPTAPRARRLRMLPAAALTAWASGAALVLLLWVQLWRGSMHASVGAVVLLLVTLALSTLAALGAGLWRVARGPRRLRSLGWLALGVAPVLIVWLPAERARRGWARRDAPVTDVFRLVAFGGTALMEADARLFYPHRLETQRLVMYHDGVATPDDDAAAMERHVAAIEREVGRPLREKICWVRGTTLGQGGLSALGVCLGSDHSPRTADGDDPARVTDRHELAHGVMNQHQRPDADVASFLNEGWAECHSYADPARRLEDRRFEALDLRARGRWVPLRELAGPQWYHQHSGPVYSEGHLWAEMLLRRYGVDRFIDLCNTSRVETFDADCRRVYGAGVDELEAMLWREIEPATSPGHRFPPLMSRVRRGRSGPSLRSGPGVGLEHLP